METFVIVQQIIIAGIIIFVGFLGVKSGIIEETVKASISKLVFNITLPLLIFTTFTQKDINSQILVNGMWVLIFSVLSFVLLNLAGLLSAKLFKLTHKLRVVHILHTMFGNIVFIGFPLIDAIFPDSESLIYAALYYLVSTTLQWTFAVVLLKDEKDLPFAKRLGNLLNPNTVAFVLGVIVMFFNVKLPEIAFEPLRGIGKTTIYLSLIYIGSNLATAKVKGILSRRDIYLLSINKLIIVPVILLFIIQLLNTFLNVNFTGIPLTVVILQTAMPCMSMIVIMAKNYGAADDKAAENVFLTTVLSLLSLPFIYFFIKNIECLFKF